MSRSGTLSNVHHSSILVINMDVVAGHINCAHTPPNENNTLCLNVIYLQINPKNSPFF